MQQSAEAIARSRRSQILSYAALWLHQVYQTLKQPRSTPHTSELKSRNSAPIEPLTGHPLTLSI